MDEAAVQDASAAVEQAKQAPQLDQNQDPEWQAIQSAAAVVARNYQDLTASEAMLEEQIRTGQIPIDQALVIKEQLRQGKTNAQHAVRGVTAREKAYNDRMRKADEAEIIGAFPEWANSKVMAQETRRLTDYLSGKGMSQADMEKLTAPEIIRHTKAMRKVIYENMTPEQRRMHDLNGKLKSKQVEAAEKGAPPKATPSESPRVAGNITQKDTDEMTGMWTDNIKAWESANGRKLSNRERRTACLTGAYPRR